MTPQELMDLPGAGKATKQLAKQGDWDEYAGLPYVKYKVKVKYKYAETDTDYTTVKARSKEEAGELVYDEYESDPDIIDDSTEILDVEELT